MALIKYEGFDNESGISDLFAGILSTLIVTGGTQSASLSLSATTQYSSGQCLGVTASSTINASANAYAVLPIAVGSSTVIVGAAVSLSASVTNGAVLGLVNANVGQVFCFISAGSIKVFRGDPTTSFVQLGNTVNSVVASLGWAFIELQVVVATGTGGSVTLQVDGATVFTLSGINTSNDSTTSVTGVMLGTANTAQSAAGFTSYFDDVYVVDSTGLAPTNTFLGPVRVVTQFPTDNGLITNFTGLAHHPNWQQVNEPGMDFDSTYNYSNTTGNIDIFVSGNLPSTSSSVYAVKVKAAGRIDDSGMRSVQTYLRSGNAVNTGSIVNLVGSYQYFSDIFTIDPNTTQPWSVSSVNLAQFGYQIVPSPGSTTAIGTATINVLFTSSLSQIDGMTALITVGPIVGLSVVTTVISVTVGIGPIQSTATLQQVDLGTATIGLGPLHATGTLSSGLLLSATITLPTLIVNSALSQLNAASATVSLVLTGSAALLPGLAAHMSANLRITSVATLAQAVTATAVSKFAVSVNVLSTQNSLTSAIGNIGAITIIGSASSANVSNIHIGLSVWTINHSYTTGTRVAATFGGITNAYQANSSGLSGATAPNGTGTAFPDGTLTWKFLSHVDYTDLTSWANAIPQTLTTPINGFLWNNGTITTSAGIPFLTLGASASPRVTSSINTITLKPAPGEGIRDALVGGSTPLNFDATKGVSFTLPSGTGGINYFSIYDGNVILDGLQFRDPNATSGSTILQQENSSSALTVANCIFDGYGQTVGAHIVQGGTGSFKFLNNLVVDRQTGSSGQTFPTMAVQSVASRVINCTVVAVNAPSSPGGAILDNSAASIIKNTIVVGYPTSITGGGGPIAPVDHCLFSTAVIGPAGIDSGNNLFNKTAANQFVSATADFRLKLGADAIDAAVTATSDIPTNDDIAKNPRPDGIAWDIGAWEK